MSEKLSLLDNSSDSELDFKINEKYANTYDVWRNKEELQKYKDLKKEEDSESSSESEDEVPVSSDEEFFTALSICKSKDPRIYDKNYKQFKDENKEKGDKIKKTKESKEKPMYMKDYERNLVLEKGGKFSDEDEEEMVQKGSAYDQEQENLKKSFKEALGDSSDDDNDDGLLKVREKTMNEKEAEEAEYMKWLKGEKGGVSEDVKKNLSYLHDYWNDPKLDEQEKFLRDYFLNKKYLETDDYEVPTYEEITKGVLSDEEMLEEQEKFEVKYNFRFEEPDEEYIKRYPRNFADSLRKVDSRRKQKRDEKADRKRIEKLQRREELKRLKALKRKEIEEKFLKLKEICGQEEINLNESDIESDFDPDKHDQKMREMFNDDYYQVEEEQKPVFQYDEELDSENWNAWTGEKVGDDEDSKNESGNEGDSHENEDVSDQNEVIANPKEEFEKEMIEATLPKKKARKKSLFAKMISQSKPLYDPDGKSFEEYLDEYYKLDYEDVIGDMPVRYKYRKVVPNDFGLTVDEILAADDRELNRWCSVKKTCQYRNEEEEMYDVQAYQKKGQNVLAKKKSFPSLFAPKDVDNDAIMTKNKQKKYVEEACSSAPDNEIVNDDESQSVMNKDMSQNSNEAHSFVQGDENKKKSKKKKHKKKQDISLQSQFDIGTKILDNASSELCNKYSEQNLNNGENSFVSQVESQKKSKKKKHGEHDNSLINADSEYLNANSRSLSTKSAMSENTPESLNAERCNMHMAEKLDDTQNSSGYNESKKKSKKRNKDRQNISKSTDSDMCDDTNNLPSANLENSPHKSTKRKRDSDSDLLQTVNSETEESSNDDTSKKFLCKSKSNNVSNQPSSKVNSDFVSETCVQEPPRKKKKKKHRQNKNDSFNNIVSNYKQQNKSKNRNDQRHSENISGDKRLGLSDERLAAYGINPKKFKSKIMYSKK